MFTARNVLSLLHSGFRSPARAFATYAPLRRPIEMETVDTTERLARLRELMKSNKVDLYSMHA